MLILKNLTDYKKCFKLLVWTDLLVVLLPSFILISFLFFNINGINAALPAGYYDKKECHLYGGNMLNFSDSFDDDGIDFAKICELENGIKCSLNNYSGYNKFEHCSKYAKMPCLKEGESVVSLIEQPCCDGLESITEGNAFNEETCEYIERNGGAFLNVCTRCGNGRCDSEYETKCNCPEDCKPFFKKIWFWLIIGIFSIVIIYFIKKKVLNRKVL